MEAIINEAFNILENKVLTLDGFDSTNYFERKKTIRVLAFNKKWFKNKKIVLSNKRFDGKIPLSCDLLDIEIAQAVAYFESETNTIFVNQEYDDLLEPILHEMIHMSCCKNNFYSGLSIAKKHDPSQRYKELNEGIINWLAIKALYGHDLNNRVYQVETRIARLLSLAIGDELLNSSISKNDFDLLNKKIKLRNIKEPIKVIGILLENLFSYDDYAIVIKSNKRLSEEAKERLMLEIDNRQIEILDKIQKIIINIYFNNHQALNLIELIEFRKLLITKDVNSDSIRYMFYPLIEKCCASNTYFDKMVLKKDKALYKSLVKSRNNV